MKMISHLLWRDGRDNGSSFGDCRTKEEQLVMQKRCIYGKSLYSGITGFQEKSLILVKDVVHRILTMYLR